MPVSVLILVFNNIYIYRSVKMLLLFRVIKINTGSSRLKLHISLQFDPPLTLTCLFWLKSAFLERGIGENLFPKKKGNDTKRKLINK